MAIARAEGIGLTLLCIFGGVVVCAASMAKLNALGTSAWQSLTDDQPPEQCCEGASVPSRVLSASLTGQPTLSGGLADGVIAKIAAARWVTAQLVLLSRRIQLPHWSPAFVLQGHPFSV